MTLSHVVCLLSIAYYLWTWSILPDVPSHSYVLYLIGIAWYSKQYREYHLPALAPSTYLSLATTLLLISITLLPSSNFVHGSSHVLKNLSIWPSLICCSAFSTAITWAPVEWSFSVLAVWYFSVSYFDIPLLTTTARWAF